MSPTVLRKVRASVSHSWAVSKTIQADGRGAARHARKYGDALVCVRYRLSPDGHERLTTVELVVDRSPVQKRADPAVFVKIYASERALVHAAKLKGAMYNAKSRLWRMNRSEAMAMGLKDRIAADLEQN